jgi:hypothetical protein
MRRRAVRGQSLAGGTRSRLLCTVICATLAACEARVELVDPAPSTAEPIQLVAATRDSALAERAGWISGVPSTTVFLRRDEDPTVVSFTTGDEGVLSLPDLPAGDYWIWWEKRPDATEQEAPILAPAALSGGARMGLQAGDHQTLPLRSQENGSLVISEFYYHSPPVSVFGYGVNYHLHWYLEVYNNADTTIYLDGKIVGAGFNYPFDAELWPCSETEPFRTEARGIWSQRFQAFPGNGSDYPVAPGDAVVISEQAIDHSTIYPGLPDMSNADFQFYWETRALNPAVPTMLPIQLSTGALQTMFLTGPDVPFVAEAVDIASLERMQGRYTGGDYALFPRETILDLAVLYATSYLGPLQYGPLCRVMVHPSLDGLGAFAKPKYNRGDEHLLSAQRKLLPDGRHLQRTGTSAADWIIGPRSPGKVP